MAQNDELGVFLLLCFFFPSCNVSLWLLAVVPCQIGHPHLAICLHFQCGVAASIVRYGFELHGAANLLIMNQILSVLTVCLLDYMPFILVTDLRETVNQFKA